jgi:hypothetical protein
MTTWQPNVTGVFLDLPAETYHKAPGVSNSMLANMDPPARLPVYLNEPREVTPWMVMGTLIHQRILETDRPMPLLAIQPETYGPKSKKWNGNATECKAWRFAQEEAGRIILKLSEYEAVEGCVDAIRAHPTCGDIFAAGRSEVSIFNQLDVGEGRVLTKARLDWIPDGSDSLVDVKKVGKGKAAAEEFIKLAIERRYHVQAAAYRANWNAQMCTTDPRYKFTFVVVEDEAPFLVNVITLGPRTMAVGEDLYFEDLDLYRRCLEANRWNGYGDEPKVVEAPEWVFRKGGRL